MCKCMNGCQDPAELNVTWMTSRGVNSANLCGVCAAMFWNKFKHTPAGQSAQFGPVKSEKEMANESYYQR